MSVYAMSNSILYFVAVLLLIEISNIFIVSRFPKPEKNGYCPFVSILVPARNEEKNIKDCVLSLLNQKYDHFEVIVLNDNSEDKTLDILKDIAKKYNRLTILNGMELPQGWYGKHWACHQLSKQAKGEWLLFTDADTVHKSSMLSSCTTLIKKTKPDLLTAFVKQHMMTFGEKITIPFPVWSIFALLPMVIGVLFRLPTFSAANGQFMLFKKSSYEKIGGHESVRKHAADDLALAREVLKHRLKWKMHDATEVVSCRMYLSFSEAYKGFIKNYFSIFNYKILVSVFVWCWMLIIVWYPLIIVIIQLTTNFLPDNIVRICYASIGVQTLLWIIPVRKFKMPLLVIILYPFIVLIASYIGFLSMFTIIFNKTTWKGRDLNPPKIKWL